MASEYDEKHLSLMAFSCAPVSTLLENLPEEDLDLGIFAEEMDLYEKFCRLGLNLFIECVKGGEEADEEEENTAEVLLPTGRITHKQKITQLLTLYLTPFYLRRVTQRAQVLEKLADTVRNNVFQGMTLETTDELRRLERMIQEGHRPSTYDSDTSEALDLMVGLEWELPKLFASTSSRALQNSTGGGRVLFRETAEEMKDGRTTQAPLKSSTASFARRKGRNPTGFPKYSPAELANLAATEADEDEEESYQTSSRFTEDDDDDDEHSRHHLRKQHSSIDESKTIEIEDEGADPNWHEKKRKAERETRVRRRIPTGHPNMMINALRARQSLEESDPETQYNTQNNSVGFSGA